MTNTPPKATDYAPYHTFPAFKQGFDEYGTFFLASEKGPSFANGVDEQAYDRGREYAMRLRQWQHRANG
jgi:hypothetical protein